MDLWELLEYVGETLVVIGVVGEVFAEWREPENKKLARASSLVLIIGLGLSLAALIRTNEYFNGTIAALNLQAKNAEERATQNEKEAALLRKETADADERAGHAEERAANLLREIQPRRLSPGQEKDIANSLKSYAGKTVAVASYSQDVEAMVLGFQIKEALGKANITVQDWMGAYTPIGRPIYLGAVVDTGSSDKELEAALFEALKAKGKLATTNTAVRFGPGSLVSAPPGATKYDAIVLVGIKPIVEESLPNAKTPKTNINTNTKP